jgi:beta-mannosidase
LIDDPYLDRNELGLQWIGESAWTYLLGFDAAGAGGCADLVFEGVDGFATISLNGRTLGRVENQHRTYRFGVTDLLKPSGNVLVLDFDPPATHAAAVRDRVGDLPNPYGTPFNFVRKMACNFGWDWGPQLTTSGLWRPVYLERWDGARITSVRPNAAMESDAPVAGEAGRVDVTVDLDVDTTVTTQATVRVHVSAQDGEIAGRGEAVVEAGTSSIAVAVDVPAVARWWPRGYGGQPLYRLDVDVEVAGVVTDRATATIGFRSVRLDTSERSDGQNFASTSTASASGCAG